MKSFILILTLLSFPALSQQIYQVNEVEKAAEPSGGVAFLNQFITANIQIPIKLAAKGMNARVFVKGVIETDGSMSGFEILRSLNKESDAEAIRLLTLYKAWKPGLVKEKPVRQAVVFPVIFRTNPMPEYDSTQNALIEYFDKNNVETTNPEKFKFRNVIPVDERGFVSGDILFQELRLGNWKTNLSLPFEKKEIWAKVSGQTKTDSVKAYSISAKSGNFADAFEEVIIQPDGKLLSHAHYPGGGRPPSSGKYYFVSGVLKEEQIAGDSIVKMINWYENGQLQSVVELSNKKSTLIKNVWEKDGSQIVKDGNGWAKIKGSSFNQRAIYEQGNVVNERKSGRWVGKFADSTLAYEEFFKEGTLENGTSYFDGEKVNYESDFILEPQFKGGKNKMFQFLGENLRPAQAVPIAKGKVILSFVVREDGHLGDYKIEQSLGKSFDDEVIRVVKRMDGQWEAGMLRGRKISVRYRLPVNFE
ncbi:energy transducer TonB [Dyadobacter subterraneus]|uniref:Energy transducer TonB n=1 Tax=Dyadobacter subterraneus TaxID=2773304 RepID=A0ABR9WJU3_9BACT|nr:energy transducer TonB [Dyadobacter subterraneus]MBE9465776.1 energy transducer TonB [Dyadobacter subterraneus]